MLANNETGVITEIEPVAQAVREAGGVMHSDAVQAAGKVKLNFGASAVDLMSVSAHKIYGPKGVGALVSRRAVGLSPLIEGGGQEGGLRGGTENVAGIVGFGKAAELALAELEARSAHLFQLRAQLEGGLREFRGVTIFADDADRLPNTTQFGVCGYDGEALVMNLDRKGLAVSSGSACASGGGEPSPVLTAMGVDPVLAKSAIRVSLGRGNTAAEVDEFLKDLGQLLTHD
jgi:cysteine desulfurase